MKKLLSITLICMSFLTYGQNKTKSITVYTMPNNQLHVRGIVHYDPGTGGPSDTSYYISAQDGQYTMITSNIILKSGTLQECYDYMKLVKSYVDNEEIKTSVDVEEGSVYVTKTFGVRTGMIYPKKNSDSYCALEYTQLYGIMRGIIKYSDKHGIPLTE